MKRQFGQLRTTGFSLVEVIVTVMVIAIAAAIVLPSFGQTATAKLREAGRLVVADVEYARSAAISHASDPRLVAFTPTKNQYHIAKQSTVDTPITRPGISTPYRVRFGKGRARTLDGVSIQSTNVQDDQLKFDLYGGLTRAAEDGDAIITLKCAGRTITVTVDHATGEPSLGDIQ